MLVYVTLYIIDNQQVHPLNRKHELRSVHKTFESAVKSLNLPDEHQIFKFQGATQYSYEVNHHMTGEPCTLTFAIIEKVLYQ